MTFKLLHHVARTKVPQLDQTVHTYVQVKGSKPLLAQMHAYTIIHTSRNQLLPTWRECNAVDSTLCTQVRKIALISSIFVPSFAPHSLSSSLSQLLTLLAQERMSHSRWHGPYAPSSRSMYPTSFLLSSLLESDTFHLWAFNLFN